ncbi:sensor histidine kinase, partial [Pseudomonadota bacterium]
CIDEVIRSLGDRLPAERITIDIQCDPILTIKSLRGDWATIFINLIDNSVRHGFRGREHGMINITVVSDAKKLQLEYRDDGVGLAPESLARIFDPFFSSDLQHGMGLGMYLVYNLISHRMGGDIQCESVLGQGVHFYIEVPQ